MAKVHKTARLDEDLAAKVAQAAKDAGESESATIARLIEAGLRADEGPAGQSPPGDAGEVARALERNNEDLRGMVESLRAQLETKDEQIQALTRLTDQAQTLHAMDGAKALEDGEGKKRRGLLARLFG